MEKKKSVFNKSQEFLEIFNSGKQFIEEILKENERLRLRIMQLEGKLDKTEKDDLIEQLQKKAERLEEKIHKMETRYSDIEKENKEFAEKYLEVEEQNNNLANLYVASYQLHSTLDFNEVVKIVMEIVINLIGSEEFALYLLDDNNAELTLVASEGLGENQTGTIEIGKGIIGTAAQQGESYYIADLTQHIESEPLAVIPLKIKEQVIGVLAIFKLLVQKDGFTPVDHELFSLLAGHAATALFSARLYTQSERKVSTLKSFLDLLKPLPE
ncbi:GAF domain-containing protein [bacterium]|nr:GAF domain-containing protein [bacterium]